MQSDWLELHALGGTGSEVKKARPSCSRPPPLTSLHTCRQREPSTASSTNISPHSPTSARSQELLRPRRSMDRRRKHNDVQDTLAQLWDFG
ncbi:hypothetical protein SRHO_G00055580 [Serrasalmus rhombeus]